MVAIEIVSSLACCAFAVCVYAADSWPEVLDDTWARENLGWKPDFDLEKMVSHAVERFRQKSRT